MIQLACMTWPYNKYPFERALKGIAEAGFRYVSIGLPHEGKPVFDDAKPQEAQRIRSLLSAYGLEPTTLISTDAFTPAQPLTAAQRRLDFAAELGVKELLSLGTWGYRRYPDEPLPQEELQAANEAFAAKYHIIGEEAAKRGQVISLKPHTGNTATAKTLQQTLQQIGSPAVKASYDPGNVHFYEGVDTTEDLPHIADQLVSFVVKDHQGQRAEANFPVPGEGDVDFAKLFTILKQANFQGPIIVERLDGRGEPAEAEEIDRRLTASRLNLIQLLNKAGYDLLE